MSSEGITFSNIIFYGWAAVLVLGTLIPLIREQTFWLRA
jgi:cytochrome c biogenesis factor